MKSTTLTLATVVIAFVLLSTPVLAEFITLQPDPVDLHDLDHYKYYTWGLSTDRDVSQIVIKNAVLFFDNIRNYNDSPNVLYIHMLNSAPDGVTVYHDNQGGGNNFFGQGVWLKTYWNLPSTPQDLTYHFSTFEIFMFNRYLQDGADIGFGFDPDCHFYNDGVSLGICYDVIPEPATLSILGLGGCLGLIRRRRRRK